MYAIWTLPIGTINRKETVNILLNDRPSKSLCIGNIAGLGNELFKLPIGNHLEGGFRSRNEGRAKKQLTRDKYEYYLFQNQNLGQDNFQEFSLAGHFRFAKR